jgi:hypothetical protein
MVDILNTEGAVVARGYCELVIDALGLGLAEWEGILREVSPAGVLVEGGYYRLRLPRASEGEVVINQVFVRKDEGLGAPVVYQFLGTGPPPEVALGPGRRPMLGRIRRAVSSLGRHHPEENPLVKVAGTIHQVEVDVWRTALERQGIEATIRELPPQATPPPAQPTWEVWVGVRDEPRARLLLGLSGHSVIRLPRRKARGEGGADTCCPMGHQRMNGRVRYLYACLSRTGSSSGMLRPKGLALLPSIVQWLVAFCPS